MGVNPCDYDYKSTLSKWNEYSIKMIWNSDYYNEIRRLHDQERIEPCKRCIGT